MNKNDENTVQDKTFGHMVKVKKKKEWNSPRCSQIDWKPKRVVSVNSATNPITGFQKNNLECVTTIEMHQNSQKGLLIFV
jgi:hypothetical protein